MNSERRVFGESRHDGTVGTNRNGNCGRPYREGRRGNERKTYQLYHHTERSVSLPPAIPTLRTTARSFLDQYVFTVN